MYLNKTQLIERGWSLRMVKDFLGAPDDVKPLGRYAEEHRYWLPRIENVEKKEFFKVALERSLKRRNAGKQAAKTQTAKRIETAKTIIIRVKRLPEDEVLEAAVEHFNNRRRFEYFDDWNDARYECAPADKSSDSDFLARITVNYIRHNLTSYDGKLRAQKGKIGGSEAVPIIRRRIFEEIICAYSHLEDECFRQMLSRNLITEIEIENRKKPLYEQLELPFASV